MYRDPFGWTGIHYKTSSQQGYPVFHILNSITFLSIRCSRKSFRIEPYAIISNGDTQLVTESLNISSMVSALEYLSELLSAS